MTQDVLDDNEDLLHQLSAELGIPDFLEDSSYHRYSDAENDRLACPSSPATQNLSGGLGGLGTGLLDDHMMDMNDSLFPDITSSSDSAYSGSIKSEPTSPFGVLPPSPTSHQTDLVVRVAQFDCSRSHGAQLVCGASWQT